MRHLALFAVTLLGALGARSAAAHEVGLSYGRYTLTSTALSVELTFATKELASLVSGLDGNADGHLSAEELVAGRAAAEAELFGQLEITSGDARCPLTLDALRAVEADGIELRGAARCATQAATYQVRLAFLERATPGHRHIAHARFGGTSIDVVTHRSAASFALAADAIAAEEGHAGGIGALFGVGIEHILTGFDHLLFLLGLLIVGGRLKSLLWVITAFTVAHSITLGIAVLGIWAPSPAWVEPIIALSVAYVAVENLFTPDLDKRWRLSFLFGLIHGFGFAGALGELHMPQSEIPLALLLFNLGVETGQLLAVGVALPLIALARRSAAFRAQGVRVVSACVGVVALYWFVERVS